MKTINILFLIILFLSACGSAGTTTYTENPDTDLSAGLLNIKNSINKMERAISELETELAEILSDEEVSAALRLGEWDFENEVLSDIQLKGHDLREQINGVFLEISEYTLAKPDQYSEYCASTEVYSPNCPQHDLHMRLEELLPRLSNVMHPFGTG